MSLKQYWPEKKFNELCLTVESNPMDSWVELFRAILAGGSSKR